MAKKRSISEVKHESDEERLESSGQKSLIIDESHIIRQVIEPVALKEGEKHLKIMSWNVNGLRSLVTTKKTVLLDLVSKHQPDVLCFQVSSFLTPLPNIFKMLTSIHPSRRCVTP